MTVGRRTVCSALRSVGLRDEKCFHEYHRVLSFAKWSCHKAARILLQMLVHTFADPKNQRMVSKITSDFFGCYRLGQKTDLAKTEIFNTPV